MEQTIEDTIKGIEHIYEGSPSLVKRLIPFFADENTEKNVTSSPELENKSKNQNTQTSSEDVRKLDLLSSVFLCLENAPRFLFPLRLRFLN